MGIRRLLSLVTAMAFAAVTVFLGGGAASATTTGPESVVNGSFLRNVAFTPDGDQVWVTSYGLQKLLGFSTDSAQTAVRTIDLPGNPEGIVILPDGIHAVVPISDLDDLAYVNLETGVVTRPFEASADYPADIALSPDGNYVAVSYFFGREATIFSLTDFSIVDTWDTSGKAATVAYMPEGVGITVTDYDSNVVRAYVPGLDIPVQASVGTGPFGQTYAPDGSRYLVVNASDNTISDFNSADIVTGAITTRAGGAQIQFASFTPDGSQVWVMAMGESKIRIYESTTWNELTSIDIAGMPRQVVFTPDGCQAYVSLESANEIVRYQLDPCFTPESSGGDGDGETDTSGTDGTEEVQRSLANTGIKGDANTAWTLFALAVLTAGAGALVVRRALRK
jgi:DNA-binding beta-propeller fold protein YncE